MRKKVIGLVLVAALSMSIIGCSNSNNAGAETTEGSTSETTESSSETETFSRVDTSSLVWSDYVTLGEYKGVEVEVESTEVTEEEIQAKIDSLVSYYTTYEQVTDRAVADGDTVNIDYTGYMDGVAFDGGTATGASLTIGSGSFIDGFEEGLVGANPGATVKLDLTFPENYTVNSDYSGKAVTFEVTVNYINGDSIAPELTDEFVAEKTSYSTVEEYRQFVIENLQTSKAETAASNKINNVWTAIIEGCTVISYPEELVEQYKTEMEDYYTTIAESYYSMTLEEYLAASNATMEEFESETLTYGQTSAISEMIAKGIAEQESITVTDEEYTTYLETILTDGTTSGFTTTAEIEEYYGEDYIKFSMIFDKVLDLVEAEAVEVPATVTE